MRTLVVLLCFVPVLLVHASAPTKYPTTYPFSKETVKPPDMPKTEPWDDEKFADAKNPGGYLARNLNCDPFSPDRLSFKEKRYSEKLTAAWNAAKPPGFRECRAQAYIQWKKGRAFWPLPSNNCTDLAISSNGGQLDPAKYPTNLIGGKEVCKKGECCKYMKGAWIENVKRIEKWMTEVSNMYQAGNCPTLMPESVFCVLVTVPNFCIEAYTDFPKTHARDIIHACYDVPWRYFQSCPLYKSTRLMTETSNTAGEWEPAAYLATLSPSQLNILEPLIKFPDRICHPYSYYNPDASSKSGNKALQKLLPILIGFYSLA